MKSKNPWKLETSDTEFEKMERRLKAWFVFVALLVLAILGAVGFVAYRLLLHFGIL